MLWEFTVPTDFPLEANRPDLILLNEHNKEALLIDISVPLDCNIRKKAEEKISKYRALSLEVSRLWQVVRVESLLFSSWRFAEQSEYFVGSWADSDLFPVTEIIAEIDH